MNISKFWKTKSMEVSVSPCTCKAAKMSTKEQAEQKLIKESCTLENKRWTVKYPWKNPKDLPNNYAQVVKRMESTERRLLSNPDHAKTYNSQMKEMEEMEFSRKLTKKNRRMEGTYTLYFPSCCCST